MNLLEFFKKKNLKNTSIQTILMRKLELQSVTKY